MSDLASLKIIVSGRVQGVCFRDFTCRKATDLRLTGYVKNLPDGTVEVLAEGARSELEELLALLRHGPPHASVENATAEWGTCGKQFLGFEVRY